MEKFEKMIEILKAHGIEAGLFTTDRFVRIYFNKLPEAKIYKKDKVFLEFLPEDYEFADENNPLESSALKVKVVSDDASRAVMNKYNVALAMFKAGFTDIEPDLNAIQI